MPEIQNRIIKVRHVLRINVGMVLTSFVISILGISCTSSKHIINGWENHYLGAEEGTLFYPDNYSSYWVYTFNPKKNNEIGYRIKGQIPNTRYLSFNLYHHKSRTSHGSLIDNTLFNESSIYEATIIPEGFDNPGNDKICYKPEMGKYSIFMRYYDPGIDKYGGVPLPLIEAFNLKSGKTVDLPHSHLNVLSSWLIPKVVSKIIAINNGSRYFKNNGRLDIVSYRHSGKGFFPNHDNHYLVIPIKMKKDEVAIFRFKPPTFSESTSDTSKDVRYWSLAMGLLDTQNPYTLIDRETKIAQDGYVYILLGEDSAENVKTTYNQIPWLAPGKKLVFLYRNLLSNADFQYSISKCPEINKKNLSENDASLFIGDYAPKGKILKIEVFQNEGFSSLK